MAVNYLNEIISIFLQRDVNELSDNDLSNILKTKDENCSAEEIHRIVQSLGSSLFQLQHKKENGYSVLVKTKVSSFYQLLYYCHLSLYHR